jgi:Flp pilus assembly protein TadD
VAGQVETKPNVADQLFASGQYQAALNAWLQELSTRPPDAGLVTAIGRARAKLGDFSGAAANFRQAAQIDPHNAEVQFELGRSLADAGNVQEAESSYRQAIALKPDFVKAHARLGYLLADMGRQDEAQKEYAVVESKYQTPGPTSLADDPELFADFGRVLTALQRHNDAVRAYTKAAELYQTQLVAAPNDADLRSGYGFVLDELGKVPEAAAHYQKAFELRPSDSVAAFNLGVVLEHEGDLPKAIEAYRQAVNLSPDDPDAYAALGAALAKAGRYQEAEEASRKATAMGNDNANAWGGLAIALAGQEQYPQAEQAFTRSLVLERDPDTARRLAQLLIVRERPEDAEAIAAQYLDDDSAWQTLAVRAAIDAAFAEKYRDDSYYDDCVAGATAALKLCPRERSKQDDIDLARLYYQRGYAYTMRSEFTKARSDFRKCQELAPTTSNIALSAARTIRRINSRYRRPVDVPRWVIFGVALLALGGIVYGARLVEMGKLPPVEYFPILLGLVLVIFAAFSLPTITRLKLGPAEMDKQVVVVSIAPPEKLK